jgi:hypothetical protein
MAPIAAGAQDYQVCWIFKASGEPPFYDGNRRTCPAAPNRICQISGKIEAALVTARDIRADVKHREKR